MERPRIPILPTLADILLETACIGLFGASLVYLAINYGALPEEIPMKFTMDGEPISLGSKMNIWFLPGVAAIIFIGLTVLNRHPHIFNYPVELSRINVIRQYRLATKLLRWIKIETVLLLSLVAIETINVSNGSNPAARPWLILLVIGAILCSVCVYLFKASKAG